MATWEELEKSRAKREAGQAAAKENLTTRCGVLLGERVFNYLYKRDTWEEVDRGRQELAEAIVDIFEQGSREEKIDAVKALLLAVEAKVGEVGRVAREVHSRVMPIG